MKLAKDGSLATAHGVALCDPKTIWLWLSSFFMLGALLVSQGIAQTAEPEGYRVTDYLADVPETLQGASVIDAEQLESLLGATSKQLTATTTVSVINDTKDRKPVLIDVYPAQKKPENLGDIFWLPETHMNIPGSHWINDVGYGTISDEAEAFYQDTLVKLTDEDKSNPLVIYCRENCWISWNAAKRAISYGYENVYWFPGGTDEWLFNDFALSASTEVMRP